MQSVGGGDTKSVGGTKSGGSSVAFYHAAQHPYWFVVRCHGYQVYRTYLQDLRRDWETLSSHQPSTLLLPEIEMLHPWTPSNVVT